MVPLFLKDWELGRVALSCHMTMDLLCQVMRVACWDSSESLGFPCSFTVFGSVRKVLLQKSERIGCLRSQLSQQNKSLSLTVDGLR